MTEAVENGIDQSRGGRFFTRFRTLRSQLILRTLLPIGLLVAAFAVVGQIGYTQVTEALVKSRDRDLATVEAARLSDYLNESVQALRKVAESPELLKQGSATSIYYILRDEPVFQHFDLVSVADASGNVIAASDATRGFQVLQGEAFEALKDANLPMWVGSGSMKDGRSALVISARYIDAQGNFGGVVEGVIALGSAKLAAPLMEIATADLSSGAGGAGSGATGKGAFSYLVASDGRVLWHPDPAQVGTLTGVAPLRSGIPQSASAIISPVDGQQAIIGYAPLNLGRLLPRASIAREWVQWYVVTQERWADVVAPINSLLFGLLALALVMFLAALVFVAQIAGTLTKPVARLVAASRALSTGRLRHRLEISGPVEIEELSHQFNAMADRLQASYADLEARVQERTQALASANAELRRRLMESQMVQLVAGNIAGTAGIDEILRLIASSAAEALDSEGSVVFLPTPGDPDTISAASIWNVSYMQVGTKLPMDTSLTGAAFKTGKPQLSDDALNDPRVNMAIAVSDPVRSILCVPLISHGQIVGVLNALNKRSGKFTEEDLRVLKLLADQTAVAIERAQLYSDTEKQLEALKVINDLALSVTLGRSVEETATSGMENIVKLTGASASITYLYDEKANTLNYLANWEMPKLQLELLLGTMSSVPVSGPTPVPTASVQAFLTQEPYWVDDAYHDAFVTPWKAMYEQTMPGVTERWEEVSFPSMIALPLTVREKRIGTIVLYFGKTRHFDGVDMQMYRSFAKILGLALYNTQLIATSSRLATVEERARLARELHDSVTQSLFSLNLTLRAAKRVLLTDRQEAINLIDNVHELAQGSLAEMRALIFELRPQALENEGLALALQKHADAVRARSGLQVHLNVQGERRLPIDSEEALYQIAREALHNIVKHAQATEAWVDLDLATDEVCLRIRDNGRGFDPSALKRGGGSHIGTSTMHERAVATGGTLEIKSTKGVGSEVIARVHVPLSTEQALLPQKA